jgi:glucosamine--fructose-6-phosphate aminotransferase (isomerizing)
MYYLYLIAIQRYNIVVSFIVIADFLREKGKNMCGIVGYVGDKNATKILIDGLSKLEYRGYDSAGVAIYCEGAISVTRRQGKLKRLADELEINPVSGNLGIGHTRWATHGAPNDDNAHPHVDCTGTITVVHNGIIENYMSLREKLQAEGHKFTSETDTEVMAHLIETNYKGDFYEAVRQSLLMVEGSYALVAMHKNHPDRIIVARLQSPLIIGHGDGENFVASDVPAILAYTRKVTYLNNGEIAVLTKDNVKITKMDNSPVEVKTAIVQWDAQAAEKSGYKHYMLKEIFEQPVALTETLRGRMNEHRNGVVLPGFHMTDAEINAISKIVIIACGTAYHAGMVGKYAIEKLSRITVEVDVASEQRYRDPIIDKNTLAIIISQSGETADTLAALHEAKSKGAHILAITNVVGSSVDRDSHSVLYTYAGPEIAVASTKAYTTQAMLMSLIALYLAEKRGQISKEKATDLIEAMQRLPEQMKQATERLAIIQKYSGKFYGVHSMLYLGRGSNFPTALEGALKLKEISYIHAEGYAAGEMKHGPIALITPQCPTVAIVMPGGVYEKMLSNIKEVKARLGHVIAVAVDDDLEIEKYADDVIRVPRTDEILSPILAVAPLQLLAYYCADYLGFDVDQPRNLAKSVTVE